MTRGFRFLLFILSVALAGLGEWSHAQAAPRRMDETARVKLGQSTVALNGPWKFHVGDSPDDPAAVQAGMRLWAQPGFDDSKWETVDLTSGVGQVDPINGMSGYASGWTMRGHRGYWGYAWYRIRVQLDAQQGEKLALSGPADIDDVYQAFANAVIHDAEAGTHAALALAAEQRSQQAAGIVGRPSKGHARPCPHPSYGPPSFFWP